MQEISITTLFSQILQGDENAFRLLFESYSRRLFHLSYSYLHVRETAEEAVLDVFTIIWNKRASLSHVKDPERYLYTSVKNQALHYLRRQTIPEEASLSLYEVELLAEDNTPENKLIDLEYK